MSTDIDVKDFGKVLVLLGGMSPEREVSLASGNKILAALKEQGVDAMALDVKEDVILKLMAYKPDRAFIALHGAEGENGTIQAVLDMLNIPYPGSKVAASALAMDKKRSKWLWQRLNLPTLPFVLIDENTAISEQVKSLNLPLCVKPSRGGSSYGVSKVTASEDLPKAYNMARQYDSDVIVEPWITGRELTVTIIENEALPVVEIRAANGFYDYEAKYLTDTTSYICPCELSMEEELQLKNIALDAFKALGCRDWGRVDVLQDLKGNFWLLEINTVPGMTDHSLVPKSAAALGIDFASLILKILAFTLIK